MKRGILFITAALILGALLYSSRPAAAQEQPAGKEYIFALQVLSGNSQGDDFVKKLLNIVFTKMGEKVRIVPMTKDQMVKAIMAKKVDFANITQWDYWELVGKKAEIHPVITVGPVGKLKDSRCIAVPKGAPYTNFKGLQGKSFALSKDIGDFIGYRYIMEDNGITVPMKKFFGSIVPINESGQTLDLIAAGKVDAGIVGQSTLNYRKFQNSSLVLKSKFYDCQDLPWPNAPIVWVGKPDPKKLKKLFDVLSNIETYPEFKSFKPVLNAIKNQLYIVTDKDYAEMLRIFDSAKKKGWIAEYQSIVGK